MKPTIVRRIPRAEADVIRTLGELGVATVHEAQGRTGLMRPYMRPIYPRPRAAGSALTDLVPAGRQPDDSCGDRRLSAGGRPGGDDDVGVDRRDVRRAARRVRRGRTAIVGLIIDAGVRDVADLTTMDFPVWSKAISAQGTVKNTPGLRQRAGRLRRAPSSTPATSSSPTSDGVVVVPQEAARGGPAGQRPRGQGTEDARAAAQRRTGVRLLWIAGQARRAGRAIRG